MGSGSASRSQDSQRFGRSGARRRVVARLLAAFLVVAGIALVSYPAVSNLVSEQQQRGAVEQAAQAADAAQPAEVAAAWQAAERYNENLSGDPVHDPFMEHSGYAVTGDYDRVLNLAGDGVMGSVEIPEISVYLPIYHGTSEEALRRGVGHLEQTALPIGGEGRRPVLSGHRGLPEAMLFTDLDKLKPGDVFYIHVLDQTLAYRVYGTEVVDPDQLDAVRAIPGRDIVTLLTCTPYGVNTQRLLVNAERTEYNPDELQAARQVENPFDMRSYAAGAIIGLGAVVAGALAVRAHMKRKKGGAR